MISSNLRALLDTIAWSELGPELLARSSQGYDVIVGSRPGHMDLFTNYADHPRKLVHLSATLSSTAAGRYQELARNFDLYKATLHLKDFSPASQDAMAIQQIRECSALPDIEAGLFDQAVHRIRNIWASLPGNDYGQPKHTLADLRAVYVKAGGKIHEAPL